MQEIIIIAGPNGAGKTSFVAQANLSALVGFDVTINLEFLNADEIAREMTLGGATGSIDFKAGRELLGRIKDRASTGRSFIVETTLSGTNYLADIPVWKSVGYRITLIYLRFANVEATMARVARRVEQGGHDIPTARQRERFGKSNANLARYCSVVDAYYIFDWTLDGFRLAETLERL
jgi:predicted ABC-type ATPase